MVPAETIKDGKIDKLDCRIRCYDGFLDCMDRKSKTCIETYHGCKDDCDVDLAAGEQLPGEHEPEDI